MQLQANLFVEPPRLNGIIYSSSFRIDLVFLKESSERVVNEICSF